MIFVVYIHTHTRMHIIAIAIAKAVIVVVLFVATRTNLNSVIRFRKLMAEWMAFTVLVVVAVVFVVGVFLLLL